MVYYTYARGPEHTDASVSTGLPASGTQLQVWTAASGGTRITALKNLAGTALPNPYVVVDSFGRYEFRIESQANPAVWMKDPSAKFWQVLASEILPQVPTAIANAAAAAATAASVAASTVTTALGASTLAGAIGGSPTGLVAAVAAKALKYTLIDVVADYGANRTGSASAATAFNNALTAANTANGNVVVWIPPGTYDLTAGLSTAIAKSNVYIQGAGRGVTTLNGQNGTLFTWGSGLDGGGLSDCALYYASPDSASRVISTDDAHRLAFDRLTLRNVRQLARIGATSSCGQIGFRDVYGYTDPTTGSVVIDAVNGAGLTLDRVVAFPLGIAAPTGTNAHPGTDLTFLRFGGGNYDTVHARGIVAMRYGRGIDINASGAVACVNMWFSDCVIDYCKYHGIRIAVAGGANVRSIFFNSGWAVGSDGYSVELSGTGSTIRHVHFSNFYGRQAGKCNWKFSGTSMDEIRLTDCIGMGANRLVGNTGSDQDDLVILGSGVSVRGGRFGEDGSSSGVSGQGRYGVNVAADLTVLNITGVEATGATGDFSVGVNTVTSQRRLVHQNRRVTAGAGPAYAASSTVTAPTSAATQTHLGSTVDTLYIYGGTATDISHNGTTVGTTGPATVNLRPGDTWAITYSVAPTIKRVVQA